MDKMKTHYHHTTDVKELAIDGTTVSSTATEIDQFVLVHTIPDISAASSAWVVCPYTATIEKIYAVSDATTTGTAALSFELGGNAVTDGGISITAGAAGVVKTATPTALNTVTAGTTIEMITNGGSTNTAVGTITFVMQRT